MLFSTPQSRKRPKTHASSPFNRARLSKSFARIFLVQWKRAIYEEQKASQSGYSGHLTRNRRITSMKLLVPVPEAAMGPRGYMPAWRDYNRMVTIFAPVGLHVLFGLCREIYFRIGWLSPSFRSGLEARLCSKLSADFEKRMGAEFDRNEYRLKRERERVYTEGWNNAIKWITSATTCSGLPERPGNPYSK